MSKGDHVLSLGVDSRDWHYFFNKYIKIQNFRLKILFLQQNQGALNQCRMKFSLAPKAVAKIFGKRVPPKIHARPSWSGCKMLMRVPRRRGPFRPPWIGCRGYPRGRFQTNCSTALSELRISALSYSTAPSELRISVIPFWTPSLLDFCANPK